MGGYGAEGIERGRGGGGGSPPIGLPRPGWPWLESWDIFVVAASK
jgi:hypothetical protein